MTSLQLMQYIFGVSFQSIKTTVGEILGKGKRRYLLFGIRLLLFLSYLVILGFLVILSYSVLYRLG